MEQTERSSPEWCTAFRKKSDAKEMLEWYEGYFEIPPSVMQRVRTAEKEYAKSDEFVLNGRKFNIYDDADIKREELVFHPGVIQVLSGKAQRLRESSNLGKRFLGRTFASFDAKRNKEAFDKASRYANSDNLFGNPSNSLLFVGGTGTGKTHLAAAIANLLVERGIQTRFGTFQSHLDEIKKEFDQSGQKHYLDDIKGTPMLIVDDLGKEMKTDWTQSILYDIVNYRYEHILPMVITTNLSADDIANHVGGAVWSRLQEMCDSVVMQGEDYRRG